MSSEDLIEKTIGRFGKFQTWILVLIAIGRYPTEFQLNNVVFIIPGVEYKCLDTGALNATNYCPCENPEYDQSTIVTSVTSEWNLICDRTAFASLAQSMMQIGILVGSLLFGYISDSFGRKPSVLMSLFFEPVFIITSAIVPQFWMFLVCRFLIGTAVGGTMLCCYVLLIELSGKSFRAYLTGLQEISFISGYIIVGAIAYYVRDWRNLQLVTSVPWLAVIVYYWLIPESPRWLITMGRKKEAIVILTYIAKKNNRSVENIDIIVYDEEEPKKQKSGNYLDLFKTLKIRNYTMIAALVWMFCSHTFFGVNQYIGRLQGNIYLNVMLSAASLAPGLILVITGTRFLNRKTSIIISFIVGAMSLLVFIFIPSNMETLMLVFAIIGQTGAYTSFIQTYLFTSELFPTVIRNSAMGFSSMFARVGGFIAPFVVNIGTEWISILIFSAIAFSTAILCCFLPETKNINLTNSIEETEVKEYNKT
ncbi:organic cation transporter protein-like [Galleria mellonella]|uniref:Organic cation transporter protein-like n=1 Tax=Galleria mellonella TaxID=7137 RepID=A0A6J1WGA1_GALME|nr:organic cation transporter protein-like [Galleria mellonella]